MKQLIDYIEKFVKLDFETIEELENLAEIEAYARNQHILEQGQRCNKIWFIKSGMIRTYYLHEGKEITHWIHTENETFTSLQSYSHQSPSEEYIQACEDSVVISITRQNSEKLVKFPQIATFTSALMGKAFTEQYIHSKAFKTKDARGKYEYLQEIAPEIIKRAKLGYIASLLGISQETLSRIRRN